MILMMFRNPIDWDDINCNKTYDKFRQYSRTNLMNHLMTFCLHRLFFKHHMVRVTANVIDADQRTDRHIYKYVSKKNVRS